jgi:hypothetical protein
VHKLSRLLIAAALGVCLAGGASAELLRWEGTLTLDFVHLAIPSASFTGGGFATINGSAGLGALNSLRLAGGIAGSAGQLSVWPSETIPLVGIRPSVALGTGVLGPISGGTAAPPLTQNALPLGGQLDFCLPPFLNCLNHVPVPLTVGGTRGAGIGGLITINGYSGIPVSLHGAPWTIATAVVSTGTTANGAPTGTGLRSGFAHGPASGTTSTGVIGGVVQLVTPMQVTSAYPFFERLGIFGVLRIALVPEPSTALLLGAGVVCLALVGRERRARR